MTQFTQYRDVKARKPHQCDWCLEDMAAGELHRVVSGRFDGSFFRSRVHFECAVASSASPCKADPDMCDGCEHCFLGEAHPRGGYTISDRDGDTVAIQVSGPILAVTP